MKVYKYTLSSPSIGVVDGGRIYMHPGRIIHVEAQRDSICLWALVDPDKPKIERRFYSVVTGQEVPEDAVYIGSALLFGGSFVAHVFLKDEGGDTYDPANRISRKTHSDT